MKRFSFPLVSLLSLAVLSGCAMTGAESPAKVLVQVDDIATGAIPTQAAVVELDGQPALLYATKDNRIIFQHGKQRQQMDETAPVQGGNRFQLHRQDQNLHAFWWSHENAKNLYFTSSANKGLEFPPVGIVNDSHGVLAPFSLLRGPQGVVGITYQDERETRYQAYFNRSTDFGRTWPKPDQRLDAAAPDGQPARVQDPQSVESGSMWVSAWVDAVKVSGAMSYRVVGRRSEDAGLNWSPSEVLFSSDKYISALTVEAQGHSIVIAADEQDRGIFAFVSQDQGRSWRGTGTLPGTEAPAGLERASNNGIRMTVAGARAHLVWMQDRTGDKARIMRASLDLAQPKWLSAAARMDLKKHETTQSLLPVVMAAPKGQLVAAWVDYRDIRPNIYLSASFDNGEVWSAPQALLKPGEMAAGLPKLMVWGEQLAIGYETYPADQPMAGNFILQLIPLSGNAKALPDFVNQAQISEAERRAKLEQRVKLLWESRIGGNYQLAYEMFDFAYKAATPASVYLQGVGLITYQSFSVNDIAINGNEASVKMTLKYEVKPTPMPSGKLIKLAPAEVETNNAWVWVGHDWYMVYSPSFATPILKY